MKKVSVVIVNYNTRDILEDCLHNLQGIYPNFEVIVVDNGSIDGSSDMVKENFKWVDLIECENIGLAAGSNKGLEKSTGDYLLYLGSDAFPNKDTVKGMVEYMNSHSEVGLATCKLVLRNGQLDLDAHRGFPTPWASLTHFLKLNKLFSKSKIFNQYFIGWEDINKPHEIDLCVSHFMLIRRKVFDDVGKWDEKFFVFGEDVDFCYRVKNTGWKIMYLPQWQAVHYKGVGVGIRKESADITTATKQTVVKMNAATTEAMKIFYHKHYAKKYPKVFTELVLYAISILTFLRKLRVR